MAIFFSCVWLTCEAQDLAFNTVRKLALSINSSCEEILPVLYPDGKKLYFVRALCQENTGGKFSGSDIWVSRYDVTTFEWGKPNNTTEVFNDKSHNTVVGISPDGSTIYQYHSNFGKKDPGIFLSKRLSNSWTHPEFIPLPFLDSDGFLGLYISPDFTVIILSMKYEDSVGEEDLYVSLKDADGVWSNPSSLGMVINTKGFEMSPFLSSDKKRLYFASNGHPGLGDADIFYSDRLSDSWDNWSAPENLGNEVNSTRFDAYFSLYDSVAYFSSNRESQFSDVYMASLANPIDSTQLRIDNIVAEARSILTDLSDDTRDSLSIDIKSIFIKFDSTSVEISSSVASQLNKVASLIKNGDADEVTLVAYSKNSTKAGRVTDNLWLMRLKAIQEYLERVSVSRYKVNFESKKTDDDTKNGIVEIRFVDNIKKGNN